MRILLPLLLAGSALAQLPMGGVTGVAAAAATVIGPVDSYYDMAGSSAGTTLTTTILNNGTIGNANHAGWSLSTSPITGFTVCAHQSSSSLAGDVQVDGVVTAAGHTSKAICYDHTQTSRTIRMGIPINHYEASWSGWITFGPPQVAAGSAVLFDYIVFFTRGTAKYCALQLNNGNATGSTYGLNIESNPSGTQHSSYQTITPTGTYWVSMKCDFIAGSASLNIYDSSFSQVGSTITATLGTVTVGSTDDIGELRIGNNETGQASGTTSTFENWVVRFSGTSPFPVGPQNTTQAPVYWAGQSHNNKTSAGTTVATTKTLDVPSGWRMVVTCSNENASGQTTSVTNTGSDTFTADASCKSAANGQSISQWTASAGAARTSQTFTCTFPSSSFSNIDVQLLSPSSWDVCAVNNKASGADSTTAAFTPNTANGINIACAYIQNAVAITAGTNYDGLNSSSTNSMGCMSRDSAPASSQTATGVHSDTSASMIVVGNYKP